MEHILAYVAVENVAYHFDILYGYMIPEKYRETALPGSRVIVPFGTGSIKKQGIILSIGEPEKGKKYKFILDVLDEKPLLTKEMIDLSFFLKDRTFCSFYEAAKVQLPTGFNYKINVTYVAVKAEEERKLSESEKSVYDFMLDKSTYLSKKKILSECDLDEKSDVLEKLISKGLVKRNYDTGKILGNISVKTAKINVSQVELENFLEKATEKQKDVVKVLRDVGSASVKEICYFTGVTSAVVSNLSKKGIIKVFDEDAYRIPEISLVDSKAKKNIVLTEKQQKAFDGLFEKFKSGGGVSLLYGVTGSGKTSVFLKLIDEVLLTGKQVIVMVPEISLTPQMMGIFKGRYGDEVAIFHSALSLGERKDEYRRVIDGKVKIAVGTRSAVFAPFKNLGLIVMDEEQEHTYKSEASPRYHARDVAKFRANYHKALLLLASATPSIESYCYAKKGIYALEKIDERYGEAVLPDVSVVDMKKDRSAGNKHSISLELLRMLQENLDNKKQSILLINRRGYNTFVACDSCGSVITCPQCSISLTFHSANNRLMCHYCGYSTAFSTKCPTCDKNNVRYAGYGTQRIEEELKKLLPRARVLRMDTDSTVTRKEFENKLISFGNREYDIMLGTQMVAKGLNFENVTLVGVINADQSLHNDDFRSEERTFDLLTQVVGRSGRGKNKGVAVIQTVSPENNVIRLAQKQDYDSFFNDEIKIRKFMTYPPYCDICSISTVDKDEAKALSAARSFLARITELAKTEEYKDLRIIVLPVMPPRLSKVNNKFRYRIIIKCKNNKRFRDFISRLLIEFGKLKVYSTVSFIADINPENLI